MGRTGDTTGQPAEVALRPELDGLPDYRAGRQAPPGAYKISSNETPYPPLPSVVEAIARAAAEVNRYPQLGASALVQRLAERFAVPAEHFAVGTGSVGVCQQIVQAVAGAGDEVVYAWRSFEAYPIIVQIAGATARPVPLRSDESHDLDAMADAVGDRTRLVLVCNPNNPTGVALRRDDLERFLDRIPSDVTVVLDEAYREFVRDPEVPDGIDLYRDRPNVVVLRTFSKAYGLAGVRVGYAFGSTELIGALDKVCIPFGVNAVAQAAAVASLASADELLERTEETVEQRDRVADALGARRSQANFIWLPGVDAQDVAERLAEQGVLVRAFPEGVRITVTTEKEADQLLAAWEKAGL